jgi:hypothetical protein
MANLLSEMGFLIADNDHDSPQKMHRLLKQTDKHLVLIKYEIRKRLICPPDPEDDPGFMRKTTEKTFGYFLQKHGFMPPNTNGREFESEEALKEEIAARSHKDEDKAFDDSDD